MCISLISFLTHIILLLLLCQLISAKASKFERKQFEKKIEVRTADDERRTGNDRYLNPLQLYYNISTSLDVLCAYTLNIGVDVINNF